VRHAIVSALAVACLGVSLSAARQSAEPDVYQPGHGVETPKLLREVKPQYTKEALDAKIEGVVLMEAVIQTDGTVRHDVKVVRSLDPTFGLDEQAVKAARQWLFTPGIRVKDKKPVPVLVTIEMAFTMKKPDREK
jgi:TonB family protein